MAIMLLLFSLLLWLNVHNHIQCSSSITIDLATITIPEHTAVNHLLVSLSNMLHKTTKTSYHFLQPNSDPQRYFKLDSKTGELRTAIDLDREQICQNSNNQHYHHHYSSCKFHLKIFEVSNQTLIHIPIIITDVNDNQPHFPYPLSTITPHISENSPLQSKLFIEQANDRDELDYHRLTYRLIIQGNPSDFPFELETPDILNVDTNSLTSLTDPNRLALVLKQTLDREKIDNYNCTIVVIDTAKHEAFLYVRIIVDDVNDCSPSFEYDKYSVQIAENIPVNTTLVQVHAKDDDIGQNAKIFYSLTDASKQYENQFAIENTSGVITLKSKLDYEQRTSYIFYIEAKDSGNEPRSSHTLVNITLIDVNDVAPQIQIRFLPEINYNNIDLVEIEENYPKEKFFAQIIVTDRDTGLGGQVKLSFVSNTETNTNTDNDNDSFRLYQIDNSTYLLNRSKTFDSEQQQWHRLTFYAEDLDPKQPLSTTKTLIIRVIDVNDNEPVFLQSQYILSIDENNSMNETLTRIEAYDPDSADNGYISYSLETSNDTVPFIIDRDSGQLKCTTIFDYELRSSYEFYIIASDHGRQPGPLSSRAKVIVNIKDQNDNKPFFNQKQYEFFISEDHNRTIPVGIVTATDLDSDINGRMKYSLDDQMIPFYLTSNGELKLNSSVDREQQSTYRFNAIVTDINDSRMSSTVPVIIHITDVNDNEPRWVSPQENHTLLIINKDLVLLDSMIGQLRAHDNDENANGYLTYTLVESKPIITFLWFQNDGRIMVNSTPILGSYQVIVQATDNGSPIRYSSLIQFQLLVGDNETNATLFMQPSNVDELLLHRSSLSIKRNIIVLSTCFIGAAIILTLIVCTVLILICRYRRNKYLYYVKCNENKNKKEKQQQERKDVMMIVENRLPDLEHNSSISTCSKLSLEDIHPKQTSNHSSPSPSYTGVNRADNLYIQQLSSTVKPPQTSDYYSNSSTHQDVEDVDEWTEDTGGLSDTNEWSIEKILYPDWLYKDCKTLNTSTLIDYNSYRAFDQQQTNPKNSSFSNTSLLLKRERTHPMPMTYSLISSVNNSPKQVHFQSSPSSYRPISNKTLYAHVNSIISAPTNDLISSYPHLNTTTKHSRSAMISKDTFI